jgi:hypothetical protein
MYFNINSHKTMLNDLLNDLNYFYKNLNSIDYIHNQKSFFITMQKFRKYIASFNEEEFFEHFYHSSYYQIYKNIFKQFNDYYMCAIESMETVAIIRNNIEKNYRFIEMINNLYIKDRYDKKIAEFSSLDFSGSKTMVIIGSGPLPKSIIFLAENTKLEKIIGLDNNQEAVFMSGEIISSLGLRKVNLFHKNTIKFNYKDADIIYITGIISQKNKILDRIAETGKDSVQILVDTPRLLSKLLYESVDENSIHPLLKIVNKQHSNNIYNNQTMLKIEKHNYFK